MRGRGEYPDSAVAHRCSATAAPSAPEKNVPPGSQVTPSTVTLRTLPPGASSEAPREGRDRLREQVRARVCAQKAACDARGAFARGTRGGTGTRSSLRKGHAGQDTVLPFYAPGGAPGRIPSSLPMPSDCGFARWPEILTSASIFDTSGRAQLHAASGASMIVRMRRA
jgi:hypothetical protein